MLLEQERIQYSALEFRLDGLQQEAGSQLKNHEETISLLVSEKATLTSELHRLDEVEASACWVHEMIWITYLVSGAHNAEKSLDQEMEKNAELHSQHEELHKHISSITSTLEGLQRKEKEMIEKNREQVRISPSTALFSAWLTIISGAPATACDCVLGGGS